MPVLHPRTQIRNKVVAMMKTAAGQGAPWTAAAVYDEGEERPTKTQPSLRVTTPSDSFDDWHGLPGREFLRALELRIVCYASDQAAGGDLVDELEDMARAVEDTIATQPSLGFADTTSEFETSEEAVEVEVDLPAARAELAWRISVVNGAAPFTYPETGIQLP